MPVVQQGSINTTALVLPNTYIQIVPPQNLTLNGVPSGRLGVVGTAIWGPVNTAMIAGNPQQYTTIFGTLQNRKYDMGTHVITAYQQGASDFRCVRVTDGTDLKAAVIVQTNCITFTAKYTGTLGNSIVVTIGTGRAANSYRVTVGLPNQAPEVFDNITGSGNALWVNMAAAINQGINGGLPSNYITAAAGAGTTAPTLAPYTLTGGTDGTATITESVLNGSDTASPRTGMYALRGQGCSVALLADADGGAGGASNTWSAQAQFGLSEGIYMIACGPSGDTITNATAQKATSGIDSYALKLMFGDWIWWLDSTNNVTRKVSPQGFVGGRISNLSPQQSSLNKQLYAIIGSDRQGVAPAQVSTYSDAELTALFSAGIDVIANPSPGGNYFAVRNGTNSSSNPSINGDNYTRMTNYIAYTLNSGMGLYIGQTITSTLFQRIRSTLLSFLDGLLQQRILGSTDGTLPYSVVCDITNNPPARTGLGYVQADVQVRYLGINRYFVINLEGGQTVTVIASQPK